MDACATALAPLKQSSSEWKRKCHSQSFDRNEWQQFYQQTSSKIWRGNLNNAKNTVEILTCSFRLWKLWAEFWGSSTIEYLCQRLKVTEPNFERVRISMSTIPPESSTKHWFWKAMQRILIPQSTGACGYFSQYIIWKGRLYSSRINSMPLVSAACLHDIVRSVRVLARII